MKRWAIVECPSGTKSCSKAVVLLVLLGLMAGCKTKPPPTRAEIQQQSLTNLSLNQPWKAAALSTNSIQDDWLSTFQDPQLNDLVREAIANNPDLRVTATRVEQAAQYVELAKAALRPTVNFLGTGGLKGGGGGDLSSALQGVMLSASWEPDLWGRMRYARNAAQESYASSKADFEFARQSLAAGTAKAWFTATETLIQKQLTAQMVQASTQLLSFAEQRQQVGAGNEQEITLARANVWTFQDMLKQVDLAHSQSLRALELLLGRYPSAELQARADLVAFAAPVPGGMPLSMLERRPDMIAAERRVAAAFHRVGEAKAARLPRLTLSISGSAISSDVLQLKDDFHNPTTGAGGRIVAPIYQGGALNTQVEIRTLEQKEAVAEYARMALRAIGEVENALAAGQNLGDRTQLLEKGLAEQTRALEFVQTNYRIGRGDLRAVQQQQLDVHSARVTLLRAQSELLAQRVNLHLALGGSFEQPTQPDVASKTATK